MPWRTATKGQVEEGSGEQRKGKEGETAESRGGGTE